MIRNELSNILYLVQSFQIGYEEQSIARIKHKFKNTPASRLDIEKRGEKNSSQTFEFTTGELNAKTDLVYFLTDAGKIV